MSASRKRKAIGLINQFYFDRALITVNNKADSFYVMPLEDSEDSSAVEERMIAYWRQHAGLDLTLKFGAYHFKHQQYKEGIWIAVKGQSKEFVNELLNQYKRSDLFKAHRKHYLNNGFDPDKKQKVAAELPQEKKEEKQNDQHDQRVAELQSKISAYEKGLENIKAELQEAQNKLKKEQEARIAYEALAAAERVLKDEAIKDCADADKQNDHDWFMIFEPTFMALQAAEADLQKQIELRDEAERLLEITRSELQSVNEIIQPRIDRFANPPSSPLSQESIFGMSRRLPYADGVAEPVPEDRFELG